jgi:hypothetical protein
MRQKQSTEIESLASRALPAALQLRFAQNDNRVSVFPALARESVAWHKTTARKV